MIVPEIKPIKARRVCCVSKYSHCVKLPTISIILGPSGNGNTVLLQFMSVDAYIYI